MEKSTDGFYTNRHSCFLLQYHLVLVTKYRHKVLTADLDKALKEYTKAYFENKGMPIIQMETNLDHIHILFEAPPQINLATMVNNYKTTSSRLMRKQFSEFLAPYYWKPYFWSLSYFIATVSERSTDIVKKYIANQKG